jgi:integrase/recombinase XerC
MPDYQIVLIRPDDSLVSGVSTQVSTAPSVWDEFLAIQLSPATRRSYAAALKDFFQREMGTVVSPASMIRYDDGRQQLQGKAAKKLAESIT